MVNFTEIRAENGKVYARAENLMTGVVENVVACEDGSYTNAKDYNIRKAVWNIVAEYGVAGKPYPKKVTVAWG